MSKEQFKLITLNVGRGFAGFEKAIAFFREQQADVLCLQDLRGDHVDLFPEIFGPSRHFVPMCRHHFTGLGYIPVGVGIFSRLPFTSTSAYAYVGNIQPVLDIEGVTYGENGAAPTDLDRVRQTESRVAIFADVQLGWDTRIRVGTTHGVWTPGGKVDDHQRRATLRLKLRMGEELAFGGVMAGDFNAATGGEIHTNITNSPCYRSVMPDSIDNTVDWEVRGKKGPNLVVDHVFAAAPVFVSEVTAHFGISDHAALSAIVRV